MPLLIHRANLAFIAGLDPGTIAFPDIDYQYFSPLNRNTGRAQAALTYAINQEVPDSITSALGPSNALFSARNALGRISNHIFEWIHEYKTNYALAEGARDDLLKKIFVWIHIWGGMQNANHVFGNWPNNYDADLYTTAVAQISGGNYVGALSTLDGINQVGISFATKHIYFWSKAKAPTFDSKVSKAVFGMNPNTANYPLYLGALDELIAQLPYPTDRKTIERNLFSFLDTPHGIMWNESRKKSN